MMLNDIHKVLIAIGIYAGVSSIWISLEKIFSGSVTPSIVDTIVAMILTYLLYDKAVYEEDKH